AVVALKLFGAVDHGIEHKRMGVIVDAAFVAGRPDHGIDDEAVLVVFVEKEVLPDRQWPILRMLDQAGILDHLLKEDAGLAHPAFGIRIGGPDFLQIADEMFESRKSLRGHGSILVVVVVQCAALRGCAEAACRRSRSPSRSMRGNTSSRNAGKSLMSFTRPIAMPVRPASLIHWT